MRPLLHSENLLLFQTVKKREKQSVVKIAGVWGKKHERNKRTVV